MDNLEIKDNIKEKIKDYKDLIEESQENAKETQEKEKFVEKNKPDKKIEEDFLDTEAGGGPEGVVGASNAQQVKNKRQKEIEDILSKDLEETFLSMPPAKQRQFKKAGEETAEKINNLMDKTKVKVKKILSLIKQWLSLVPGINKFFLEKEAKIKVDEIMKSRKKYE